MSLLTIRREKSTALLILNNPQRRNLLSFGLCEEISAAVREINADESVKAVVISGAGSSFCAGADLDDLQAAAKGETDAVHAVYRAFMDVAECTLPTIAAVNGPAVGAGFNLALACDMRIAGASARFETRFLKIGLHPGGGHGWMLLRAVGWAEATRLLLLDQPVDADAASAIGLVQRIVPDGELIDAALALAARAEALPRDLMVRSKASLRLAAISDHQTMFDHETKEQMHSLHQPPFEELIRRMQASIKGQ
jgi:enoyl-CoA hydratase